MRRHTYTCNKGYADGYKGREISWDVPETLDEALSSGAFSDEKTLVRYAVAQLNIAKGHAIQAATIEQKKGEDGKPTGELARPNMSLADMEQIAAGVTAKQTERAAKGTGGQKQAAKQFNTAKDKAKQIAETASPEKLATLLELGLIDQSEHDTRVAKINESANAPAPAAAKRR